ncbi:cysteate racemase [Pseudohaliea rubra]|uniref:Aspartate racemase n=1 Tax=Pseudohaliea rubra DSM 19751 TaxID=1265313 RepID=A0A095VMY9_9GAMM|nr:amino acid racemase [Pseudohaliea rubra]KGE02735.1 Aspartate racemase [Pseudohaliea rubra DSM 19751]
MNTRCTVGVLGGLGPAATVDFMARLIATTPAATDQEHLRLLVDHNPTLPNRHDAVAGRSPSVGPALAAMARGLERAGADCLVMVCNTAHAWEADIRAAVDIPFLSIIDATVDALDERAPARVGVMAADGCLEAGLYQRALAARGREAVLWSPAEQAAFMALVYRVKAGERGPALTTALAALADALAARGAEALIAACTEIPLVLSQGDAPLPLYASTDLLVARTLAFADATPGPAPEQGALAHG